MTEQSPPASGEHPPLDSVPLQALPEPPQQQSSLRFIGNVDKLMTAMAAAQGEFQPVKKDSDGQIGNQKFKYANLATLTRASMPALSKHGISVMQFLHGGIEDEWHVLTTACSGHGGRIEWDLSFRRIPNVKEYGSNTTYLRRYAYQAALVLDGEVDADSAPSGHPPQKQREPAPPQQRAKKAEPKQGKKPEPTEPKKAEPKPEQQAASQTTPQEDPKPQADLKRLYNDILGRLRRLGVPGGPESGQLSLGLMGKEPKSLTPPELEGFLGKLDTLAAHVERLNIAPNDVSEHAHNCTGAATHQLTQEQFDTFVNYLEQQVPE